MGEVRECNEVERWERWEVSEVAGWESGQVGRWKVLGFLQGWEMQGEFKISSFCVSC